MKIVQSAKLVVTTIIETIILTNISKNWATSIFYHILGPPCHLGSVIWGGDGGDNKKLMLSSAFGCPLCDFLGGLCVTYACNDPLSSCRTSLL